MTRAACEFVTPLTFAALSGQKVITDLFAKSSSGEADVESAIEHIAVAQRTDLLLVAPATADILAKFARGLADDFLSTLYLASTAPAIVAPAMNVNMWQHAATRENLAMLKARGVHIVEPNAGYLACGMTGPGRLAELDEILKAVHEVAQTKRDIGGETLMVTAGPTCEDIDPVRYITNRSSGKMGYAVAETAARRGAKVILISGPTALAAPDGVERVDVRSAAEMFAAARNHFADSSMAIFAAAVADYRPADPANTKIKQSKEAQTIRLEPNTDILATLAQDKGERIVVGFAAETDHVAENARKKLTQKNADLIVANNVTGGGRRLRSRHEHRDAVFRDGRDIPSASLTKSEVAERVLDEARSASRRITK